MKQVDISRFRASVKHRLGNRVKISTNKGRHKTDVTEGVLKEAYNSIFTVEVDNGRDTLPQVCSFTYTDVLTEQIQMTLC